MTYVIIAAIALFFIFEGILPFLAPKLWRRLVLTVSQQSDRTLHITGFICMLIGVILLYIAHHFVL